jgi:NhaA family Na+:H+ antiporter
MSLWNGRMAIPGGLHLPDTVLSWVNNFMMAFFFLLVSTEIKREWVAGELSSFKNAILPLGAAFGGMMVPALLFIVCNLHTGFSHGWGIPTATDIAFSLAAASLLGKRFPVKLKIFLMALAIIDDLGAILVIAVFYGGHLQWSYLIGSGFIYLLLLGCRYFKIRFGLLQVLLGFGLWYTMLQSGVEASIAGVLFAFAMPIDTLSVIEKSIHKYVNFLVLPLFALANTTLVIPSHVFDSMTTNIGMGIIFGLVIGKPLGIFLVSRVMVGLKIARLPANINWQAVFWHGLPGGDWFYDVNFYGYACILFTSGEGYCKDCDFSQYHRLGRSELCLFLDHQSTPYPNPYSSIFLYTVVNPIFSSFAASTLFPFV